MFHFRLRGAHGDGRDSFGNVAGPHGTLNSFQSTCDGFVKCLGGYVRRVLDAFEVSNRNPARTVWHVRDCSNIRLLFASELPSNIAGRSAA